MQIYFYDEDGMEGDTQIFASDLIYCKKKTTLYAFFYTWNVYKNEFPLLLFFMQSSGTRITHTYQTQ